MTKARVLVAVGGGIAAYKAVELVRELARRGAEVRVAMTRSATRFIGPTTFAGITGHPAATDLWDPHYPGELHVELGDWADRIVVAPATANLLARARLGMADDVVLATLACARGRVLLAPAMHTRMWLHPATQDNVATLRARGCDFVGPVEGPLANGETGLGRMAEPTAIADVALRSTSPGPLAGRRVLVSAGPTLEDLDPVRFLGNRSSGRMGYAVAEAARDRGANVTLVSGPVSLAEPAGLELVRVRSALEMHQAIAGRAVGVDVVVMAAAVADYRPASVEPHKRKKGDGPVQLGLVRTTDILRELGLARTAGQPPHVLVGFCVETQNLLAAARAKLTDKGADLIVANTAAAGFGGDDNEAALVRRDGHLDLGRLSKRALADRILDEITSLLPQ